MMLKNLRAIVSNYLAADIGLFVLALSIETRTELDSIRTVLPMPLKVIRLTVPLKVIHERLRSDTTSGRHVDLRWAGVWLEEGRGVGSKTSRFLTIGQSTRWRPMSLPGWAGFSKGHAPRREQEPSRLAERPRDSQNGRSSAA